MGESMQSRPFGLISRVPASRGHFLSTGWRWKMELQNLRQDKEPYEPPKATFVPIKLEERLMGCGLTSYCGANQYYQ